MSQQQSFVDASGGGNVIPIFAFVQTTDDNPTILLDFGLGVKEGTWLFNVNIAAYDIDDQRGLSADCSYTIRTTATTATEISEASITYSEDAELAATDVFFGVLSSPNQMVVDVTGLAATTINWVLAGNVLFVGV